MGPTWSTWAATLAENPYAHVPFSDWLQEQGFPSHIAEHIGSHRPVQYPTQIFVPGAVKGVLFFVPGVDNKGKPVMRMHFPGPPGSSALFVNGSPAVKMSTWEIPMLSPEHAYTTAVHLRNAIIGGRHGDLS